jgi:hypothetical protein
LVCDIITTLFLFNFLCILCRISTLYTMAAYGLQNKSSILYSTWTSCQNQQATSQTYNYLIRLFLIANGWPLSSLFPPFGSFRKKIIWKMCLETVCWGFTISFLFLHLPLRSTYKSEIIKHFIGRLFARLLCHVSKHSILICLTRNKRNNKPVNCVL